MGLKMALINLQCEMVAERSLVNPKDISWLQYDILFQLMKEKEIRPSALSVTLGISRAKLSKALKSLKEKGYVCQSPGSSDGRELYTSITESGYSLLQEIFKNHQALYRSALSIMTAEEQKEYSRLSQKLADKLKSERRRNHV